jgi:hypothetical protein
MVLRKLRSLPRAALLTAGIVLGLAVENVHSTLVNVTTSIDGNKLNLS